jgi:hypothetical protein
VENGFHFALNLRVRDRRSYFTRQALVRRVVDEVLSHRRFAFDAVDCARTFGISTAICQRILHELERVGIIRQPRPGLWVRAQA